MIQAINITLVIIVKIKQSNRTMQIIPKNDLVLKQGYYTISLPDLELTNNKNTFGGGVYCSIKSKNLYNCKDTANVDGLYTVDKNDWIKNSYDNSTGTSTYYQNYWTNKLKLKAYTQQLIILEVQAVEGDGTLFLTSATETIKDQFQNTVRYDFSDLKAGDIKISKVLTVANFADSRYGLRSFIAYNPGQKGSITFRISILEDTSTTEADFKYEKFGEKINESVVGFGFSNTSNSWSFKMPREAKINYFYLYLSTLDNDNATAKFSKVQLTKGDLPHNYIPFGKYGVEIAFNNRNLLPNTQNIKNQISQGIEFNQNSDGTISLTGKSEGNRQSVLYLISKPNFDTPLTLEPGTYYMLPSENNVCPIIGKVRDVERYPSFPGAGKTSFTLATKETYESIYFQVPKGNQTTFKNFIVYPIMSLDELKSKDDYVNYQRVTATIILDEPLRSLPNGVKDELYLRGGIAYVERNVGSYKFTGTEEISVDSTIEGQSLIRYAFDTKQLKNAPARILGDETLCTHFIFDDDFNKNGIYHSLNTDNKLYFDVDVRKLGTVANFKDWLSTNNVELIYPLASMQVEHLGEFETPKTYENISYIFANDDSKPVLHLEYVRNTTISNYVENQLANERELRNDQYAEFLLQSDQIKSTVSQVQNTLDSNYQEIIEKFNGYVPTNDFALLEHSVTNLQTNTYTKTEINTKLTDGSVTKVKTTSLLADDDGLTVDKNDSKTKGNLDADGLTVIDKTGATEAELLFAGYDAELGETVVRTNNIKITRYTDIGSHSRFQDYEDGTGIFNK